MTTGSVVQYSGSSTLVILEFGRRGGGTAAAVRSALLYLAQLLESHSAPYMYAHPPSPSHDSKHDSSKKKKKYKSRVPPISISILVLCDAMRCDRTTNNQYITSHVPYLPSIRFHPFPYRITNPTLTILTPFPLRANQSPSPPNLLIGPFHLPPPHTHHHLSLTPSPSPSPDPIPGPPSFPHLPSDALDI